MLPVRKATIIEQHAHAQKVKQPRTPTPHLKPQQHHVAYLLYAASAPSTLTISCCILARRASGADWTIHSSCLRRQHRPVLHSSWSSCLGARHIARDVAVTNDSCDSVCLNNSGHASLTITDCADSARHVQLPDLRHHWEAVQPRSLVLMPHHHVVLSLHTVLLSVALSAGSADTYTFVIVQLPVLLLTLLRTVLGQTAL